MEISPKGHAKPLDIGAFGVSATGALLGLVMGRGANVAMQILIARVLGPESFGVFAIGLTIFLLAGAVATLGLQNGVIYFGSPLHAKGRAALRDLVGRSVAVAFVGGAIIGLLSWQVAGLLANSVFFEPRLSSVVAVFSGGVPLAAALTVAAGATKIFRRAAYSIWTRDLGQPLLNVILVGLALAFGGGLLAVVEATVVSIAVALIVAVALLWRLLRSPAKSVDPKAPPVPLRTLLAFSFPTAVNGLLMLCLLWSDRLFVGALRSATETGVYQAASQLSLLLPLMAYGLNSMFAPVAAQLHAQNDRCGLSELFVVSTKWGLYVTVPLAAAMILVPDELLAAAFGVEFGDGALALTVLGTAQLINVATGPVGMLLAQTGHPRTSLAITSGAVALNVALNGILVPTFGINGAALATATSVAVSFITALLVVRSKLALWPYDSRSSKVIVAGVSAGVAVLLSRRMYQSPASVETTVAFAVSIVGFFAVLRLFGWDSEDRLLLRSLGRP